MARKFTPKSQGGYIELDDPDKKERDDESLAASIRDDANAGEDAKR